MAAGLVPRHFERICIVEANHTGAAAAGFLATLSAETFRLAASETAEAAGEVLAYATACISALFNDSSTAASDDDLDRLTPRVYVMLILEGLQRRGYVRVDYGDALDPMALEARIQMVGDLGPKPPIS